LIVLSITASYSNLEDAQVKSFNVKSRTVGYDDIKGQEKTYENALLMGYMMGRGPKVQMKIDTVGCCVCRGR
jgi:hypothetical protein